jgi:hypothetical protein
MSRNRTRKEDKEITMENKTGEGCYLFSRINEYGNLKVIRVPAEDVEFYKSHLPESVRNLVVEG